MHQVRRLLSADSSGVTIRQIIVVLSAILVYVLAYLLLYADVGRATEVVVTLPVMVAGGLWGFTAGLVAGILSLPFNGLLLTFVEGGLAGSLPFHSGSASLFLIIVVLGGVVGWLRDLGTQLDQELVRRSKAQHRQALQIEQLQEALTRSRVLYQTAHTLLSVQDHPWSLQSVVDKVVEIAQADRAALVMFDPDTGRVVRQLKSGNGATRIPTVFFDEIKTGLCGQVLRAQRAVLLKSGCYEPSRLIFARSDGDRSEAGSVILIPIIRTVRCFGLLVMINGPEQRDFTESDLRLLQALCDQTAVALHRAEQFERVQTLAMTDELTALYNRRGLYLSGQPLVREAHRQRKGLAALMIDVDHFKRINDRWGHAVGDEVLQEIAGRLRRAVPQAEVIGRYGGEEFAVLLPDWDLDTAWLFAEQVRQTIARRPISTSCGKVCPTVSVGVATLGRDASDLPSLLKRADNALYAAKAAGRNRTMVA